jgi:hypothetical protein
MVLRTVLIALAVVAGTTTGRADPSRGHPQALPTEVVTDRFYVTPTLAIGCSGSAAR